MSDYYQLLGVPRNASAEELKEAFRKRALENHPDRINHLPADEQKQREQLMYDINEAWNVLSKPEKRKEYDRLETEKQRTTKTSEGSSRSRYQAGSYEDLFTSIFNDSGIFGKDFFGNSEGWGDLFGKPTERDSYFMIPENDWGLLVALRAAYESKIDGKWRVRKSEDDKRNWMPDEIYSIKRENEKVHVFRRIIDWRSEWNREKPIEARKDGNFFDKEKMKPDTFLGEYYLCGKGRSELSESYDVPYGFEKYLQSLKSLAGKFARGDINEDCNYDVSQEFEIMNRYGKYESKNTRVEGQSIWINDNDREWVKKVSFGDFWKRMKQAEGQVRQIEGVFQTKEGSTKSTNNRGGPSGESLG